MEDTVVKVMQSVAARHPDSPSLISRGRDGKWQTMSFREFAGQFERVGAGLLDMGVKRGDHVGIISDTRREWIIANLGILGIGAADVPRGSDTMADEARYILQHADCAVSFAENADQARKILSRKKDLPALKSIIVFDEGFRPEAFTEPTDGVSLFALQSVAERGKALLGRDPQAFQREVDKGRADDLGAIIYTSGTTGEPKGVMLTHSNFLHNFRTIPFTIDVNPGDTFLSVLPVWHSFERMIENFALSRGAALAFSKPIGKIMMADMAEIKPTILATVPRIWEGVRAAIYRNIKEEGGIKQALFNFFVAVGGAHATLTALVKGLYPRFQRRSRVLDFVVAVVPFLLLYPLRALGDLLVFSKIKARLGGKFRFTVSGGGALPPFVDRFFQAAGVLLLEGYGLTETTPVVSVRLQAKPVPGTIGPVLKEMEVKLLDPESGAVVPRGNKGVIYLKGPNVMKGYYKRPDKTAEVLGADGWLNTGDLGMQTHDGELKIIGRVKETIVLLGGENVEPVPIEDTILESEYIDQVMVVGQDQKFLAALVIPNDEAIEKYAAEQGVAYVSKEDLLESPQVLELVSDEINSRVCAKRGFREFERIFRFHMVPKHFEAGVELSAKQSVKRDVVARIYAKEIAALFAR